MMWNISEKPSCSDTRSPREREGHDKGFSAARAEVGHA